MTARALRSTGQGYGAVGARPESAGCQGAHSRRTGSGPHALRGPGCRRGPGRGQNGPVTTPATRTVPRHRWLLAAGLIALAALPVVLRYLVFWPLDQWQVDVEVYREAGVSILSGRPIYSTLTESPQLLPFTYPPFAAILAIPLALMPFGAAGLAVDRAAGARHHRDRLVRRLPAHPPRRSLGAPRARRPHRAHAVAAPGQRRHPLRAGQRLHGARLPHGPARAAAGPGPARAARGARRARDGRQAHAGGVRRALPRDPPLEGGRHGGRHRGGRDAGRPGCSCRRRPSRSGVVRCRTPPASGPTWARRTSRCGGSSCGSGPRGCRARSSGWRASAPSGCSASGWRDGCSARATRSARSPRSG